MFRQNGTAADLVSAVFLAALTELMVLPLLIYAAAPLSGAHLNPLITLGTFFTRLATLPRTVLYISAQSLGGVIGGYLVRASLGSKPVRKFSERALHASFYAYLQGLTESYSQTIVGGCWMDTSIVSLGESLATEVTADIILLYFAFGLGLDPRQNVVFSPALGPILIGLALATCVITTGLFRDGYSGACKHVSIVE